MRSFAVKAIAGNTHFDVEDLSNRVMDFYVQNFGCKSCGKDIRGLCT
jgi:hypothetical protein